MVPSEMEQVASAVAAAIIRNKGLKDAEAAAVVYFECLEALMAIKKLKTEEENRQFLSSP